MRGELPRVAAYGCGRLRDPLRGRASARGPECASRHLIATCAGPSSSATRPLQNAYAVLGLTPSASNEDVKQRFVALAKRLHPDATEGSNDSSRFVELRNAYELIVRERQEGDTAEAEGLVMDAEDCVHDIRHTAPQHRVYLEYGGFGMGTPSQRQKQYLLNRAVSATNSSIEYLLDKRVQQAGLDPKTADGKCASLLSVTREQAYFAKKQKTTNAIERMVEDMILQAMKNGDFSNLKGAGKPLKADGENPYIDSVEFKINKILINNGFVPPWIMKDAEIRNDMKGMRDGLRSEYARYALSAEKQYRSCLSAKSREERWENAQKKANKEIGDLNKAIHDYNLVTPSLRMQLFPLRLDDELSSAMKDVQCSDCENVWREKARKSLDFLLTHRERESEGLFSQFVNAVIGLRYL